MWFGAQLLLQRGDLALDSSGASQSVGRLRHCLPGTRLHGQQGVEDRLVEARQVERGGEWAARGIRVNSISPGYTRTLLVQNLLKSPEVSHMEAEWLERTPMGRMAEVTDLQGALVYLASPASDFTTGTDIIIDGGYCAW